MMLLMMRYVDLLLNLRCLLGGVLFGGWLDEGTCEMSVVSRLTGFEMKDQVLQSVAAGSEIDLPEMCYFGMVECGWKSSVARRVEEEGASAFFFRLQIIVYGAFLNSANSRKTSVKAMR